MTNPAWRTTQYLDGWHAQRMGLLGGSNPYHPQTQSQSHLEWETGFHARRNTLKHGGEGDVQETDATRLAWGGQE